jgi:hypothetical protein
MQQTPTPNQGPLFGKTIGKCICDVNYIDTDCEDCVKGPDGIMKGTNRIEYNITWQNCTSNDPTWAGCSGSIGKKSKVTFCYGDGTTLTTDCDLFMQIDNPPVCLSCLNFTTNCYKLKATCAANGSTMNVSLDYSDPETQTDIDYSYQISVVGDPIVRFKCKRTDPNTGQVYETECQGEF